MEKILSKVWLSNGDLIKQYVCIWDTGSMETIISKKHGIRNSHLLSIQPTGNSSFFGNNVSGGGEPIFLFDYIRTAIQPFAPEGLDVPKNIDFSNTLR